MKAGRGRLYKIEGESLKNSRRILDLLAAAKLYGAVL